MHALAPRRFREYETVFILAPEIKQSAADSITERIQGLINQYEGKLLGVSLWGRRKLAYRIKKFDKGIYYQIRYVAPQGFVEEMERQFRLSDNVLRYLTVKTSDRIIADISKIFVKEADVAFGSVEEVGEVEVPETVPPSGEEEEIEERKEGGKEEESEEEEEIMEPEGEDFVDIEIEEEKNPLK